MTNRYSIALRDGDEHYVEADCFEFRDGCLVFSKGVIAVDRPTYADAAVFGASELKCVRLLDDPIRRSDRPPLDMGRGDDAPMRAVPSVPDLAAA